jgi:hypothetical protein
MDGIAKCEHIQSNRGLAQFVIRDHPQNVDTRYAFFDGDGKSIRVKPTTKQPNGIKKKEIPRIVSDYLFCWTKF